MLLEIAVEEKLNLEFVGAEESRRGVVIGPRSKLLAFWVTARGMHKARGKHGVGGGARLLRTRRSALKETACLQLICG